MPDLAELLRNGAANLWVFIPVAIMLGALHGLEPGHSKTMMAAFIVAIRGTVGQAVLLGLAATLSHTAVVWAVAMAGLSLGERWSAEHAEGPLQVASGVLILIVAGWMAYRIHRDNHHDHDDDHHHDHEHDHLESGIALATAAGAHERAHAAEIGRRFTDGKATTGQIVAFGLTGGLIPCPASISVLLVCLRLKKIALGALLVLCFSLGLALTMVSVGVAAAVGTGHLRRHWTGLERWMERAPYVSVALIAAIGLYSIRTGLAATGV